MHDLIKLIEAYHFPWSVSSNDSATHPYMAWVGDMNYRHKSSSPFTALFHALHDHIQRQGAVPYERPTPAPFY